MSIEVIGQRAYDYQYLATAYMAVCRVADSQSKNLPRPIVVVEKLGREDAEIRVTDGDSTRTIELQAKSVRSGIDQHDLAKWLLHFAPRSTTDFLLKRLAEDTTRCVFFITPSRCQDSVSRFAGADLSDQALISPPTGHDCDPLVRALGEVPGLAGDNTLARSRRDPVLAIVDQLKNDPELLINTCQRIVIWELADANTLRERLASVLNRRLTIPQSACAEAAEHVVRAVRAARDEREGCGPED